MPSKVLQATRPPISESSLIFVPENAVEGYQTRIETGIVWTEPEKAYRHHKNKCFREVNPTVTFSEGLQERLKKSIIGGLLDVKSGLTFEEQYEINVPMLIWDVEKFGNEEEKICFRAHNSITDDLLHVIKVSAKHGTREALMATLKEVTVLRVLDAKITDLDSMILEFKSLETLNLCGNYIKTVKAGCLPPGLIMLELQANALRDLEFTEILPENLTYLGMARNYLSNDSNFEYLSALPRTITVLDLQENDIYSIELVLDALINLLSLASLHLAGNPCSLCAAYARTTIQKLPQLQYLDGREVSEQDRKQDNFEPHPDDLRSTYLNFTVIRIISVPEPPKLEKGVVADFYMELELPLLDSERRQFLMFRRNESLNELLPPPEDDWVQPKLLSNLPIRKADETLGERSAHPSDIYIKLTKKESREIQHYTTFRSQRAQWNKIMYFQDPTVRVFCPDLRAVRDTFRSEISIRLVYQVTYPPPKPTKDHKKSSDHMSQSHTATTAAPTGIHRVVLAELRCALRRPDWKQVQQQFHWDSSMTTNLAIPWTDGNLACQQFTLDSGKGAKQAKAKPDPKSDEAKEAGDGPRSAPDHLTFHVGFGVETISPSSSPLVSAAAHKPPPK